MHIRYGKTEDAAVLSRLEAAGYPKEEGASFDSIHERLKYFSSHFWILEDEDHEILAFVNGFVTDQKDLTDDMYDHAEMHDENGSWQMIFSVCTSVDHRNQGYASLLLNRMIKDAEEQHRKGVVLTCKDRLISFYEKFGFVNEGVSVSTHGNVKWYQMRLTFDREK